MFGYKKCFVLIQAPPTPTGQSQRSIVVPTFPPTFVTSIQWINRSNSSSPVNTPTMSKKLTPPNNLRLAESLFKSNSVLRQPSVRFVCSNCQQAVKCCDASVQTSAIDDKKQCRGRIVSHTGSDDEFNNNTPWIPLESHYANMTVQEYQLGGSRKPTYQSSLPAKATPQMHDI